MRRGYRETHLECQEIKETKEKSAAPPSTSERSRYPSAGTKREKDFIHRSRRLFPFLLSLYLLAGLHQSYTTLHPDSSEIGIDYFCLAQPGTQSCYIFDALLARRIKAPFGTRSGAKQVTVSRSQTHTENFPSSRLSREVKVKKKEVGEERRRVQSTHPLPPLPLHLKQASGVLSRLAWTS